MKKNVFDLRLLRERSGKGRSPFGVCPHQIPGPDGTIHFASEPAFGLDEQELRELLNPSLYIGRCPEQVEAFLKKLAPLLESVTEQGEDVAL